MSYGVGVQVPSPAPSSERTLLRSDFSFAKKNQSCAPSFLLFREKARLHRRTACKRAVLRRFTHYHFFTIPRLWREGTFWGQFSHVMASFLVRRIFCKKHGFTAAPFPHKSSAFAGAQNHYPPVSLLLIFREKSRSIRLLVCKRTRNGSQSLPAFHDMVSSAQPKSPAATAFVAKSCKNTRTTSRRAFWFAVFFCKKHGFTLSAAAPFSQESSLGLPVRLQVRSRRQAVATTFLRYCALRTLKNS